LGASWRFFDRSPDDPLIDAAALEASPLLARLSPLRPSDGPPGAGAVTD